MIKLGWGRGQHFNRTQNKTKQNFVSKFQNKIWKQHSHPIKIPFWFSAKRFCGRSSLCGLKVCMWFAHKRVGIMESFEDLWVCFGGWQLCATFVRCYYHYIILFFHVLWTSQNYWVLGSENLYILINKFWTLEGPVIFLFLHRLVLGNVSNSLSKSREDTFISLQIMSCVRFTQPVLNGLLLSANIPDREEIIDILLSTFEN